MSTCTDHLNGAFITAGKQNNQWEENAQIAMLIESLTLSPHAENRHQQN